MRKYGPNAGKKILIESVPEEVDVKFTKQLTYVNLQPL